MVSARNQLENRTKFLGVLGGLGNNVNNMIGAGIFSSPGKNALLLFIVIYMRKRHRIVIHPRHSFIYVGTVWRSVGSPWIALLLWLIGGIVSIFGTLTYTEVV
jgi:hypothetical protein